MYAVLIASLAILALPRVASAHCPLCTAGAGILAILAARMGLHPAAIGVFLGAAAASMGYWMARYLKRKYVPWQDHAVAAFSFATTVIPLLPMFDGVTAINLYLGGAYGNPLFRTYAVNSFLLGSIVGAVLLGAAPYASRALTRLRKGTTLPYQGMALTFVMLLVSSALIQVFL